MTAHDITNEDLARLRPRRMQYAMENLETYRSTLEAQQIPSGLLDTPPYEPQYTVAGCMPACYNMIFNAIAQNSLRAPNQVALTSLTKYGGCRFDEDVLLQSLSTAHFRQKTGKLVTSKVLIGADFDDIARRAALVKQKRRDASVYATVGIKNFDSDYGEGLHGVVLLGVTEDTVSFHNPYPRKHHRGSSCSMLSTDGCGAFDTLDKAEFIERWAVGMHEARLVIARSDPSYTG